MRECSFICLFDTINFKIIEDSGTKVSIYMQLNTCIFFLILPHIQLYENQIQPKLYDASNTQYLYPSVSELIIFHSLSGEIKHNFKLPFIFNFSK